jgi:ABC-type transporter Mla subunit MlaD
MNESSLAINQRYEVFMSLLNELEQLSNTIKQKQDEIRLQAHLATMDAKDELEHAEKKCDEFFDNLDALIDETHETSAELIQTTKIIGDELLATYHRIQQRLAEKK